MSTTEGGGNIVTDGLILYSDAANPKSFISGNTSWYDLTRNQNHGTITGATYDSGNLGSLGFNGTTQYVNYGTSTIFNLDIGSASAFIMAETQVNSNYKAIIVKQERYGLFVRNNTLWTYDWGNIVGRDTGFLVSNLGWFYVTLTFTDITGTPLNNARVYVNGVLVLITTVKFLSNNSPMLVGNGDVPDEFYKGKIASIKVYNRVLSPAEVMQNYNATRKRFGL